MSARSLGLSDELHAYLLSVTAQPDPIFERLKAETLATEHGGMQISPEQAQFMTLLVKMLGARRIIEVGTFTGYSAMTMARALPADGKLIACDVSEEWTAIGQRYWAEAGVADKIDLRIAPARQTLDALIVGGQSGSFDMAFIDADKENYPAYYDRCLTLIRPGGLIAIDNTLWSGAVADKSDQTPDTRAIRETNAEVHKDPRVESCLIPIGDGLMLAWKK